MSKLKNLSSNRAITLIALIITIIVMLILVAVSVSVLVESDLIGAAEKAGNAYKTAVEQEQTLSQITIGNKTYASLNDYFSNNPIIDEEDPETPVDPDTPTEPEEEESAIGTWLLNETIPYLNNQKTYSVDGYSALSSSCLFNKLYITASGSVIRAYYSDNGFAGYTLLLYYKASDDSIESNSGSYVKWKARGEINFRWVNSDETARTIIITGGDDATNDEFIAWLKANATKQ